MSTRGEWVSRESEMRNRTRFCLRHCNGVCHLASARSLPFHMNYEHGSLQTTWRVDRPHYTTRSLCTLAAPSSFHCAAVTALACTFGSDAMIDAPTHALSTPVVVTTEYGTLGVAPPRTIAPLPVTPRRYRSSFASRWWNP
jgi:hypothetical protein